MTNADPGAQPSPPPFPGEPSLQDQVLALEITVQLLMGILAGTRIMDGKRMAGALEKIASTPAMQSRPGVVKTLRRLALGPGSER